MAHQGVQGDIHADPGGHQGGIQADPEGYHGEIQADPEGHQGDIQVEPGIHQKDIQADYIQADHEGYQEDIQAGPGGNQADPEGNQGVYTEQAEWEVHAMENWQGVGDNPQKAVRPGHGTQPWEGAAGVQEQIGCADRKRKSQEVDISHQGDIQDDPGKHQKDIQADDIQAGPEGYPRPP